MKPREKKMQEATTVILETKRLILRTIGIEDANDLHRLFSDPVAMKHYPSTKTKEETIGWVQFVGQHHEKHGFSLYGCVTKDTHEFIGYCGFIYQADVDGRDEIEIGYGLIRDYWHMGYASEAAIACKYYGFNTLNAKRLVSLINPSNVASIKVAERNGMTKEKEIIRWGNPHSVYFVEK